MRLPPPRSLATAIGQGLLFGLLFGLLDLTQGLHEWPEAVAASVVFSAFLVAVTVTRYRRNRG